MQGHSCPRHGGQGGSAVGMEGLWQEWYKEPQQGGVRFHLSFEESQKGKQSLLLFSGVRGLGQTDRHIITQQLCGAQGKPGERVFGVLRTRPDTAPFCPHVPEHKLAGCRPHLLCPKQHQPLSSAPAEQVQLPQRCVCGVPMMEVMGCSW